MGRWPTSLIESGNQLSSQDDVRCMELSSSSCAEIGVPVEWRWVSLRIPGVAQRKPRQLSCMMGNGALL